VFQNPELFPTQVSLSPKQSTLVIFGRNENLVQNQLSVLTKLNIYKQTVKFLDTAAAAAAAVHKKGT
jgi:hypothetical protein